MDIGLARARNAVRRGIVGGVSNLRCARAPLDPREVERQARSLGFQFPVAIDRGWTTLRRYWLDHAPRAFTRVSFVIDRQGIIRHIHPGGQYVRGDLAFSELEAHIEAALRLPAPWGTSRTRQVS